MQPYTFPILINSDDFLRQLAVCRKLIQAKFNIVASMTPRQVSLKTCSKLNQELRSLWEKDEILQGCKDSDTLNVHELRSLYTILLIKSPFIDGHNPIIYLQRALNHKNLMSIQHYLTSAPTGPAIVLHGTELQDK